LRIDGHTDPQPLRAGHPYSSNWELSTARALSVVEFLASRGLPPQRMVAAGFGEHRPAVAGDDAQANQRNRRIEIKLTSP
jgi:chemotaxis protein MotB